MESDLRDRVTCAGVAASHPLVDYLSEVLSGRTTDDLMVASFAIVVASVGGSVDSLASAIRLLDAARGASGQRRRHSGALERRSRPDTVGLVMDALDGSCCGFARVGDTQ